jgi:hypothetical protein
MNQFADTDIHVMTYPSSLPEESTQISSNLTLRFDPSLDFSCGNIRISDCEVDIHDLCLRGSMSVRNATLRLVSCLFRNPLDSCDLMSEPRGLHRLELADSEWDLSYSPL